VGLTRAGRCRESIPNTTELAHEACPRRCAEYGKFTRTSSLTPLAVPLLLEARTATVIYLIATLDRGHVREEDAYTGAGQAQDLRGCLARPVLVARRPRPGQ
jgi:hypothetical protein